MAIAFIVLFVLIGVVIFELLGALWYGPLFGGLWARSMGKERTRMNKRELVYMMAKLAVPYMFISFALLLIAFVLPRLDLSLVFVWQAVALLVLFSACVSFASYVYEKHSLWGWVIQYGHIMCAALLVVTLQYFMLW